ncbi:hypothetical protein RhiJN_18529 [Ceratobasidium sp. AG-Ba]|nr:hypothetical protein RhiJN_18529 [Ceratobasidium sp. AG-Ba]
MVNRSSDAVARAPASGLDRAIRLGHEGIAHARRFDYLGKFEDLEKAIKCNEEALRCCAETPFEYLFWGNMGVCRLTSFGHRGEPSELAMAREALERALKYCPPHHPTRAAWLGNLGVAHSLAFDIMVRCGLKFDWDYSGTEAIQAAISHHKNAADRAPEDGATRIVYLLNLGNSHAALFDHRGEKNDLNEAIEYLEAAMSLMGRLNLDKDYLLDSAVVPSNYGPCLRTDSPTYFMVREYANHDPFLPHFPGDEMYVCL